MAPVEQLMRQVKDFWYIFNSQRRTLSLKCMQFVYDEIQKAFISIPDVKKITQELSVEYNDDSDAYTDIRITCYTNDNEIYESDFNEFEFFTRNECEGLIRHIIIGRENDVETMFIFTRETTLEEYQNAMGL